MEKIFSIDENLHIPIYKQILSGFEQLIESGELAVGSCLPSMNELAAMLDISKETSKKVYSIMRERGLIESIHGKGFYVLPKNGNRKLKIFMLLDKLSQYKQILYDAFIEAMGDKGDITIHLYNQEIDTFEEFIENSLNKYDYYFITPHFSLDATTQARALRALKRIPNRKLVMVDNWMRSLPGNYGAVYQDVSNDIYYGLGEILEDLRKYDKLHVVILPSSLYGSVITVAITRFCEENNVEVEFHCDINEAMMSRGGVYLLLNGQLGIGLVEVSQLAISQGLEIGKDIGVISYNDSYLSAIILGGLTTVSTDFVQMGHLAAKMIVENNLQKVHCDFRINRRKTF